VDSLYAIATEEGADDQRPRMAIGTRLDFNPDNEAEAGIKLG
jgi:hypothetical protein